MKAGEAPALRCHEDPDLFREALSYTVAATGFPSRLIEKDYFCSALLERLMVTDVPLVFKGGTCLAKVHTGFHRLSEDLDFAISLPADTPRRRRSELGRRATQAVSTLPEATSCFRLAEPVRGANLSTHYVGVLSYASLVSEREEPIRIEIDLREPLLAPAGQRPANCVLMDPVSGNPMSPPVSVRSISRLEAFAEKFRAALTRRDVAIRDFYDIDYAVQNRQISPQAPELLRLVRRKLIVPGNRPVDLSETRTAALRRQVETQLRPVLRESDFGRFDLDRAFRTVAELARRLAEQP